jgi:ABC-2 type transport system ATP-binding protein
LAIEAVGLTKTFGATRAVDGVDLEVPAGSVYGFLGPNGAGKTTTIRILATLLRADSGRACVFGHDVVHEADAVRRRLSLTSQFASVDEDLTGFENLTLLARLLGFSRRSARTRAHELLEAFELADAARRSVSTLSGGMRRRLDLAASLVVVPDLLFLDEPTTGLDPWNRRQLWDVVRAIAREGTTVLLTTQYLDEADALADRIAVIDRGAMIAEGTSAQLKASVGAGTLRVRLARPDMFPEAVRVLQRELHATVERGTDPAELETRVAKADGGDIGEPAGRALAALSRAAISVTDFSVGQPTLDQVFLTLTGHPSHADGADAPE